MPNSEFQRLFDSLEKDERDVAKIYILAVVPLSFYDLKTLLLKYPSFPKIKDAKIQKIIKRLSSLGITLAARYETYMFSPAHQAVFFNTVYQELHEFATKNNLHQTIERHSFYYYEESLNYSQLFQKVLYLAVNPQSADLLNYAEREPDVKIVKVLSLLYENTFYHPILQNLQAKYASILLQQEIKTLINFSWKVETIKEKFLLLMDLQEKMKDYKAEFSIKTIVASLIYSLSGNLPLDENNLPWVEEELMPKSKLLKEVYQSADISKSPLITTETKSYFVLKNRLFDSLSIMYRYALLLHFYSRPDIYLSWKEKLERYFQHENINSDFKGIIYVLEGKKGLMNDYINRLFLRQYINAFWVEQWSALLASYIFKIKLAADVVKSAEEILQTLYFSHYYRPALELSFVLQTSTKSQMATKIYDELLAKLGTPPLISHFRHKPEYEEKLVALGFLSKSLQTTTVITAKTRVCYLLNFQSGSIQPIQQTQNKNGWSKGKNLSLQKLAAFDYENITELDKGFIGSIKESRGFYGSGFGIDKRLAWRSLTGHPYLFTHNDEMLPVELVMIKPSLIIEKKGDHFMLKFDYLPQDYTFPVLMETATRFLFIDIDQTTAKILQYIPKGVLSIPEQAKELLKTTVADLAQVINVYADEVVGSGKSLVKQVEPDTLLRVLLTPLGNGLRAQIAAKPFGAHPPYCVPGEGAHTLFSTFNNERIQVFRNLTLENEFLDTLLENISGHGLDIDDQYILRFEDPFEALKLLEALHDCKDLCKIEWPEGVRFSLRSVVPMKNLTLNIKKSGNWFELNGELRVDEDLVINMKALLDMKRNKGERFLELSDGQFISLSDSLRRKLDELQSLLFEEKKGLKISPLLIPTFLDGMEDFNGLTRDKATKEFQQRYDQAQVKTYPLPALLQAELRPYQEEGFNWMARLTEWGGGACLADDMGLGKTVQSIAFLLHKASGGASLVVCPASVLHNWLAELNRFAPVLRLATLGISGREQTIASLEAFDVLVTTYGLMQSEEDLFIERDWNVVILDEAHIIKNHQTKTHHAATKLKSKNRIVLTGTPIQNRLDELWSIFSFINPGLLGSVQSFNKRYSQSGENPNEINRKGLLKKIISPFILRRLKQNVLEELPPKTEIVLSVELSEAEQAFYEALRRNAIQSLQADDQPGMALIKALAEITRLRLASCNVRLVDSELSIPSSKLSTFIDLILELKANNHRALVFSQFTSHLALVREELDRKKIEYLYLDGSTPIKQRGVLVKDFQQKFVPLFLISLKAGGLGLNLTAADFVIHLDPWWNPAVEDQATDRAHRIGQNRPVTVYRIVAKNTIEEKIIKLHHTKREMAERILLGNEAPAKLSINEMMELLQTDF